jgi:hypothetical protein
MDFENAATDATVAAAVAATTIAVALALEFVFAVQASPLLRLAPLSVYVIYLFTHRQLPDGLDTPRNWIRLAAIVGVGVLGVVVQFGG